MWLILFSGLISGGMYIAISLGVVLTFRFARVVNFSQGAFATLSAYVAWQTMNAGMPAWVAIVLAILTGIALSFALGALISRYLSDQSELVTTMATFGPTLIIAGVITAIWGQEAKSIPTPSALSASVNIFGADVSKFGIAVLITALAVVAGTAIVLRRSHTGLALRSIADDPSTSAVNGINVGSLERLVWAVSGALAGLGGVAISTYAQLDPNYLTTFLIQALTAIVLGGIGSLGGLVLGCLIYGQIVAFVSYYVGGQYVAVCSLLVLVAVYALRPSGILGRATLTATNRLPAQGQAGRWRWLATGQAWLHRSTGIRPARGAKLVRVALIVLVVLAALLLVPLGQNGPLVFVLATVAATVIVVSGQNVASGVAGRLSVAQAGFMLVGAYSSALLITEANMPILPALGCSAVIGMLVGGTLGVAISKLSGLYLGILTLQFTLAIPEIARSWKSLTGGETGMTLPPLGLGDLQLISPYSIWIFSIAIAAIALVLLELLNRSQWGARLRAARDSPLGAESIGLNVRWLQVGAVAISAGAGALGGALSALQSGIITPESFTVWISVYALLGAAIGGKESLVIGPIIGATLITLVPYLLSSSGGWSGIIFGALAVAMLVARSIGARTRAMASHGRNPSPLTERQPSVPNVGVP
ncbi:ABC transporter permease [Rhodococcus wratislaviensis]|uniref:Putative ABC transporter permease protein n=1 Tax=Rhodococcus wratislaviensis NBRC 100605 TaxID=1219028 RepID=X0R961_RHOWR|nr:ABC transporter permease [Rhodococcus wratislaviensis]GAF47510.1 putative ABC transporter permease protein [Rhodococcus wratislaviensis NBRC 100605]